MSDTAAVLPAAQPTIGKLALALAKAQGAMSHASKDKTNPAFKSKYADLAAVMDAIREPLANNELALIQRPALIDDGKRVSVETLLVHSSGEMLACLVTVPLAKADAQGVGSAITYARRYGAMAMTGIAPDDDDGNAAVGMPVSPVAQRAPVATQRPMAAPRPAVAPAQSEQTEESKAAAPTGARFEELRQWIEQCASREELGRVSKKVGEAKTANEINADERRLLLAAYTAKANELKQSESASAPAANSQPEQQAAQ